jgi:hypothetical protein
MVGLVGINFVTFWLSVVCHQECEACPSDRHTYLGGYIYHVVKPTTPYTYPGMWVGGFFFRGQGNVSETVALA